MMNESNTAGQGPQRGLYSEAMRYGFGGIGIALAVCSVICNGIIITAFVCVKNLRKTCNVLIINNVLGDLFCSLARSFDIVLMFSNGDPMASTGWFRITSTYLNFCNISALACERFIAIQFPYRHNAHVTYTRCVAVAIGIWIISGFQATIRLYISFKYIEPIVALTLLVLMVVIYARIYVVTRRHIAHDLQHGVRVRHSKAMAAILTAVVSGLSWSPVVCSLIMKHFFGITVHMTKVAAMSELFGNCFNLLIYTYRMEDFKKGVKHILRLDRNIVEATNTRLATIR